MAEVTETLCLTADGEQAAFAILHAQPAVSVSEPLPGVSKEHACN